MPGSEIGLAGEFNPILFHLKLHIPENTGEQAWAAYFHEYVHFLQNIGTTWGISRVLEVLNWIAEGVEQMGGNPSLILNGLARPVPRSALQDLVMHRKLDGAYGSRMCTLPEAIPVEGSLVPNLETGCIEYIRWNEVDQCYFATPVGAHTLRENLAYVSENIGMSGQVFPSHRAPSNSDLHNYTVGTEFFWNAFPDQRKDPSSLILTAVALMDACLQIPNSRHLNHPDWVPMTAPGFRFASLTEVLPSVRFIDVFEDLDYSRFIGEIFNQMGWPAPSQIVEEHVEWLTSVREHHMGALDEFRSREPAIYEAYFRQQVDMARRNLNEMYGETHSADELESRFNEYEHALRSDPLVAWGKFGLGFLEYIVRALRIRLEHPLWLAFPHAHFDELTAELSLPIYWHAGDELNLPSARAMSLFFDIKAAHHLWALTVQWLSGKRAELECGYRYFGIPCSEPTCKQGKCPNWTPASVRPRVRCTFVDVATYFRLWKE